MPQSLEGEERQRGKLGEVLKQHRIRRIKPGALFEAMRADSVRLAPGIAEAAEGRIHRLARSLSVVGAQIREVEQELQAVLSECQAPLEEESPGNKKQRDASIVLSMPGVGTIVGATLLGEAPEALRSRDYKQLRCLAGTAPVTRASGKRSKKKARVHMRYACNSRLRAAVFHMARTAIARDEAARAQFRSYKERGHDYSRSLRSVADRLLRILVGALKSGALYEPDRLKGTYAKLAAA